MGLASGSRVGVYEITGAIGAGGMGEVYRARDTKLDRDVALKILPDSFAGDPDRLMRFEREARTLAALNHPQIAQIHGIEDSGGVRALVMELVDGETLAERIARGALPFDEALPIAQQIAEALEAAHDAGIIHRDLKPANIKVRPDGAVKVLDFGLAKSGQGRPVPGAPGAPGWPAVAPAGAEAGAPGAGGATYSPTFTSPAVTVQGVILGTAAYMSPEQAKGRPVDKRADIWAFGCVLFEMLTGMRAFEGEDVSDTLASVLRGDADWTRLPADVPPSIDRLLRRCLARDVRQRLSSMAIVRFALDEVDDAPREADARAAVASVRPRYRLAWMAAGVVAVIGAALAGWTARSTATGTAPIVRFADLLPEGTTFRSTGRRVLAVSPDGRSYVYNAADGLRLRRLDAGESVVAGTESSLTYPVFSSDGQWIAYWSGGRLMKIPVAGGVGVALCDAENPVGLTWEADGTILFGQPQGIMRVSVNGGTPELVVAAEPNEFLSQWDVLPGAETLLVTARTAAQEQASIVAYSIRSKARKTIVQRGRYPRYLASGHLVYAEENTLFAVRFDAKALEGAGGAVPLLPNVMSAALALAAPTAQFDLSRDGTLVYAAETGDGVLARNFFWVDRAGRAERVTQVPSRAFEAPRLSPDERRVLVRLIDQRNAWIFDLERGASIRLTDDGMTGRAEWSPDGTTIAISGISDGSERISLLPSDGSGMPRVIGGKMSGQNHLDAWSPDGTHVLFHRHGAGSGTPLMTLAVNASGAEPARLGDGDAASFSPDGKWVVYRSSESGQNEIYITPFPGPGGKFPVSADGGDDAVWGRNGEIFYLSGNRMMAVRVQTSPTLQIDRAELLFESRFIGSAASGRANYAVTRDGKRFLMLGGDAARPGRQAIHVVLNFAEEVRQRVPIP